MNDLTQLMIAARFHIMTQEVGLSLHASLQKSCALLDPSRLQSPLVGHVYLVPSTACHVCVCVCERVVLPFISVAHNGYPKKQLTRAASWVPA